MKITVLDSNARGSETMLKAIGICRGKKCTTKSLEHALGAKPVPHMSVLEFGWVCLLVEGVSVKTRIQLERHRMFSSIERSTRSVNMVDAKYIIPSTVKYPIVFKEFMGEPMESYEDRVMGGESLEDVAYLLPLGIETSFLLAGNLRVWYEYFGKRLCKKHVQREHYDMALGAWNEISELFPIMRKAHPCAACGACSTEI